MTRLFDNYSNDYETTICNGKITRIIQAVSAKTEGQRTYLRAIANPENRITFGIGPAGTGKTHISVGVAVGALRRNEISRIICVRPAVGAGDHMGFLPGTAEEKIAPFLRPILMEMTKFLHPEELKAYRSGEIPIIEIQPVDFMRGLTFEDCFIIVDESQNCTREQMKMIITRLGMGSRMVVSGDVSQNDLNEYRRGALEHYSRVWTGDNRVDGVACVELTNDDIVRDPFLRRLMEQWPEEGPDGRPLDRTS